MTQYLALLRGINVGGKNKVPMSALRGAVADLGYGDVQTYIQSGNVLFSSGDAVDEVESALEQMLPRQFTLDSVSIMVLVHDAHSYASIIDEAPPGFGAEPDTYHYDVAFLKGTTGDDVVPHVKVNPEVDTVWAAAQAIFYRRLSRLRTRSRMGQITQLPAYQKMTIRSWSTTSKLLSMLTH